MKNSESRTLYRWQLQTVNVAQPQEAILWLTPLVNQRQNDSAQLWMLAIE